MRASYHWGVMRYRLATHQIALVLVFVATQLVYAPSQACAQDSSTDQWSTQGRLHAYVRDLVGPGALLGTALATTVDHVRTDPPEWGDDGEGLARRAASNAARLAVEQTVRHGFAIALGRSTRYQRCDCTAFFSRAGHAVVETLTDRDRTGQRAVSVPRFAGIATGALAQTLWRPDVTASEALLSVGGTVVFQAAGNVVKEVLGWPR
jgi:hypothetical protein